MAWFLFNTLLVSVFAAVGGRGDIIRPIRLEPVLRPAVARAASPVADPAPVVRPPKKVVEDSLGVRLTAPAAALVDSRSGEILFSAGQDRIVPVASITKLMTALVFLDAGPDWDKKLTIAESDNSIEGLPYLKTGEMITVRDAFYVTMTGSVNSAAQALSRSVGLSREQFVAKMNSKAQELGLTHSSFVDPSGYLPGNASSVLDVARLAFYALEHAEVRDAVTRKEYVIRFANGSTRTVPATNQLLSSFLNEGEYNLTGGKTGYTQEAGYTLVLRAKRGAGDVIAVVLGSPTSEDRFQDAKSLLVWGFRTYAWE